jgi:hypothetical protein
VAFGPASSLPRRQVSSPTVGSSSISASRRARRASTPPPSASVHPKRFSTRSFTHKVLCAGNLNPRLLNMLQFLGIGSPVYYFHVPLNVSRPPKR